MIVRLSFDMFGAYIQSPLFQSKEIIEYKHLAGWRAPPVAIRRFPQFVTLSWIAWCTSSMLSFLVRLMCSRSVLSTYKIAERWCCSWVIGQKNLAPCPFFLCTPMIHMLITA